MLNVLSLFSGIGAFEKALERERVLFRVMNFCEIDKYASKSYCAIHGVSEQINLRDVSTVNTSELHDVNLITYGFPCQDISQAGHQKGFFDKNGNVTRSGLFFAALKIIKDTKPEYAIAENVKALTSKKFTNEFKTVLDSLEQVGYNNYYKVLNAKDFGVPQNRERVFIVSIRKDIDFKFTFPVGEPLKLRLADLLENEVDPKFYLSDEQIKHIKTSSYHQNQRRIQSKEWCDTLCSRDWKDPKCVKVKQVFNLIDNGSGFSNPQTGRVYATDGLSPCLNTMQGGGREPKILKVGNCNPDGTGCNGDVFSSKGLAATVTTNKGEGQKVAIDEFKIRKLTPLECWRLMGFDDEDFYRAQNAGISNSQLYKQAGNSIVVNVLQAIFRQFDFEKAA
jgi:DNA (cytosine-5)-methyltransferase 1